MDHEMARAMLLADGWWEAVRYDKHGSHTPQAIADRAARKKAAKAKLARKRVRPKTYSQKLRERFAKKGKCK